MGLTAYNNASLGQRRPEKVPLQGMLLKHHLKIYVITADFAIFQHIPHPCHFVTSMLSRSDLPIFSEQPSRHGTLQLHLHHQKALVYGSNARCMQFWRLSIAPTRRPVTSSQKVPATASCRLSATLCIYGKAVNIWKLTCVS